MKKKRILVCGAGGFIGTHLVEKLKEQGHWVRGVDLKHPEYSRTQADEFVVGDLRDLNVVEAVLDRSIEEVYQLAADMGGAGFVFTGENDSEVMHNSALINIHVVKRCVQCKVKRVFYSSSACIYPEYNQMDPLNPKCSEESAYPAAPDSEYGWEKLFSERLYFSFHRNHKLDVRVMRFHNIFGPLGTWRGGREKAPAALARKVVEASQGGEIEIWGTGLQTRSFLYIDECIEGILRFMESDFIGPVNLGSEEMVTINELAGIFMDISGKKLKIKNVKGPTGVNGRNSDNKLILEKLDWAPSQPLRLGLERLYDWVCGEVEKHVSQKRAA